MKELEFKELLISYGFKTRQGSPYIIEKGEYAILIAIDWYYFYEYDGLNQKYTYDNLEPIKKIERSIKLKLILK